MRVKASTFLVPLALGAMGCFALVFQGCERKSEGAKVDPSDPESYMRDEKFMSKLREARKAQVRLVRERNDIAEKMREKIEATKERLKTDDLKKVDAELKKDPEWIELYTKCTNANAKCAAHQKELLKTVGRRITPKKQISK